MATGSLPENKTTAVVLFTMLLRLFDVLGALDSIIGQKIAPLTFLVPDVLAPMRKNCKATAPNCVNCADIKNFDRPKYSK